MDYRLLEDSMNTLAEKLRKEYALASKPIEQGLMDDDTYNFAMLLRGTYPAYWRSMILVRQAQGSKGVATCVKELKENFSTFDARIKALQPNIFMLTKLMGEYTVK